MFKTELKEIESGNLRNGLKHHNNDKKYSYYISDERSIILELEKGSKNEPWFFLIKKESIEIKKFFTKKTSNCFFYKTSSLTGLKNNLNIFFKLFPNLSESEKEFLIQCSKITDNISKGIREKHKQEVSEYYQKKKLFLKTKDNIIKNFDKDNNGIVDIIESDDFLKLLKKHQNKIIEIEKNHINDFIKISNYLKNRREDIQKYFLSLKKSKDKKEFDEHLGLIKNQIHSYELIILHSIRMIVSIVELDLITFNQIYEEFDKLKIFKSDHENEVSEKLDTLSSDLKNILYSINKMEINIIESLNHLSFTTEEGFSELNTSITRELDSINSSMKFNNLITGIQSYQLYKLNKKSNS